MVSTGIGYPVLGGPLVKGGITEYIYDADRNLVETKVIREPEIISDLNLIFYHKWNFL